MSRIAPVYGIRIEILGGDTVDAQDAVTVADDASADNAFGADPDTVLEEYAAGDQVERAFLVIVVTAEKQGPLRDADIVADLHLDQAVYPDVFADPNIIGDDDVPGVFDVDMRLNDYIVAYFGAEHFQQDHFQAIEMERRIKKHGIGEMPYNPFEPARPGIEMLVIVGIQLYRFFHNRLQM